MAWKIEYIQEAQKDMTELDHSRKLHVLKAIEKVSENSLPSYEGGYGKPLGNNSVTKLAGYYKIKLLKLGIRVVYNLEFKDDVMRIIVISVHAEDAVYKLADKRIK
ncbi:MAG: type II toxin-antitoxin system RelE/ParE family toxin [Sedimentibacter sp.]|uniref:type II toxin-antitoxin system RelE family toxin n=1 Tax=Sedimentibacter sp. TaxID=1960295 RepID=UPI003158D78B